MPLKTVLMVPFVVQTTITVGLVGYLSFKNGQQTVNNLAHELMIQVSDRIDQHLKSYTALPQQIVQLVADDLELGKIHLYSPNLQNLDADFLKRIQVFNSVSFIYAGNEQGKFIGAVPVRKDGQLSYIIEVTDGTTNKNYVSYALKESEAKYRRQAENVPSFVYRFVLHSDGIQEFTYVSPGVRELYEYEAEIIAKNPQLPWQVTHPEDVASLKETILISAQTLQPWKWEGRIIPPSGRLKWVQGISRPEKQPLGDIIWDGVIIDITERKQAEQLIEEYQRTLETQVKQRTAQLAQEITERKQIEAALVESEARYRGILEDQTELIARFKPDGTLTFVNQAFCRYFGLTREELIGYHYEPVIFEQDREHVARLVNSISR
ncbi:PAS domain-containing protein [Microseira wollei]|uniref:PAS domain-containing protein n=1 Tax=Microseira wollei TaxID=467598 RepID=UPI001CFECEA5|nr:PAS domain S-box protein [Microseira wollei]